jgi:hypothetical protein
MIDTVTTLIGLIMSFFGDSQPLLAVSNIIVNAGCFASACWAPEKGILQIGTMIGTGSAVLSSALFLVPEPTCETIAWVGFGLDAINTLMYCGFSCAKIDT